MAGNSKSVSFHVPREGRVNLHLCHTDFHLAKYRFSFRKVQIFISQSTDFHLAKYRFPFSKVQIFISQSTDFYFAKYRFRFVSQSTIDHVDLQQFAIARFFLTAELYLTVLRITKNEVPFMSTSEATKKVELPNRERQRGKEYTFSCERSPVTTLKLAVIQ